MTFGAKLQQIRKAAGLSQEQLADMIDMSRQSVSKWETDQATPDIEKLSLLCEIFSVSADELLGNTTSARRESEDAKLEKCIRMNVNKRYFTVGWMTALLGTFFLILEYFSLFLLRAMAIRLETGYYDDPMQYALIEPMPAIFKITAGVIVAGIALAVCSAAMMRTTQKKQQE